MNPGESNVVGDLGETEVAANLQRIRWAPPVKFIQDVGDDLLTIARDRQGNDLGLPVVLQVKSSWTEYTEPRTNGGVEGWWHTRSDIPHFDHWVRHGLPCLLILHDLSTRTSFWVHVTGAAVKPAGDGVKIFVPASQRIDWASFDALLAVAAFGHTLLDLEGTVWKGYERGIAPGDLLRYALVAPRLLAPHGNQAQRKLQPAEVAALLASVRFSQLDRAQKGGHMPMLDEMTTHKHWNWRFVGCLHGLLVNNDRSPFHELIKTARHPHQRTAARILYACAAQEDGDLEGALAALVGLPKASPTDKGWMCAQRARILSMLDRPADAADDARLALEHIAAIRNDPTATAIRAGAAWVMYRSSAFAGEHFVEAVASSDTAVTWWRAQRSMSGLSSTLGDLFLEQFEPGEVQHFGRHRVSGHNELTGSLWNAAFAADLEGWRHAARRLALHSALVPDGPGSTKNALSLLMRAGHLKELEYLVGHLWKAGPLDQLLETVRATKDADAKASDRATLSLWAGAGDLLDLDDADRAVASILDRIQDPNSVATSGVAGWYRRIEPSRQALARLQWAASDSAIEAILAWAAVTLCGDEQPDREVAQVIEVLDRDRPIGALITQALFASAKKSETDGSTRVLAWLANHEPSTVELIDLRAASGQPEAQRLRVFSDRAGAHEVSDRIQDCIEIANAMRDDGEHGSFTQYGRDVLFELAFLAIDRSRTDAMSEVVEYLASPYVADAHKSDALWYIAKHADAVPADDLDKIAAAYGQTADGVNRLGRSSRTEHLAVVCQAPGTTDEFIRREIVELLRHGDNAERASIAHVVELWSPPDAVGLLTGLVADRSVDVRAAAVTAMVHLGNREAVIQELARPVLDAIPFDDGCFVASAVASCLTNHAHDLPSLVAKLQSHPSAVVKSRAREANRSGSSTVA